MAEKRLIDANAMRDDWLENGENEYVYDTNAVLDSIDSQPTVDAVEAVRCKDCKERNRNRGIADSPNGYCFYHETNMNGYGFCSYGERKDGDGNG